MKLFWALPIASLVLVGCRDRSEAAAERAPFPFQIAIVTAEGFEGGDGARGAEELIRRYGRAPEGLIRHISFPSGAGVLQEPYLSNLARLAVDPGIRAIVLCPAVPGTAELFSRIRTGRPDILLFAGEPQGALLPIQAAADLVVGRDFFARGFTMSWAAKELGARTFVHISFPRHLSYETVGLHLQALEAACKDLGLAFAAETVPDPASPGGRSEAQRFILEMVPRWILKYGADTAFFCTADSLAEPLIRQLLAHGGMLVETDLPSPLLDYPEALGLELATDAGDYPAILKRVERAVVDQGGASRFGTWAYGQCYAVTAGLGELAKRTIGAGVSHLDFQGFKDCLAAYTPGTQWRVEPYVDPATGVRARNHFLIYTDTFIMGRGYLPTTRLRTGNR